MSSFIKSSSKIAEFLLSMASQMKSYTAFPGTVLYLLKLYLRKLQERSIAFVEGTSDLQAAPTLAVC